MQAFVINLKGINKVIALVILCVVAGCDWGDNRIDDKSILLSFNDDHRRAHMEGNANLFVAQIGDTLTMVQDGEITQATKEEIYKMFDQYFKTVEYNKWDDVIPPKIIISEDASLATLTTQKSIALRNTNTQDNSIFEPSLWAWTTTYQKIGSHWKLISISSGYKDSK